jgi:hypothetical protein
MIKSFFAQHVSAISVHHQEENKHDKGNNLRALLHYINYKITEGT